MDIVCNALKSLSDGRFPLFLEAFKAAVEGKKASNSVLRVGVQTLCKTSKGQQSDISNGSDYASKTNLLYMNLINFFTSSCWLVYSDSYFTANKQPQICKMASRLTIWNQCLLLHK
jgi:hypothetical protein